VIIGRENIKNAYAKKHAHAHARTHTVLI